MYKTKNINKYLFLLFLLSSFITSFTSLAEENLHSGDYIINPKTGKPEPFFPDLNRNLSDHVQGCENNPGIEKNISQFNSSIGWLKTSLIGKHKRCDLSYGSDASELDRELYAVGQLFNTGNKCAGKNGLPCQGTASLVYIADLGISRKYGISAAHNFYDYKSGQLIKGGFIFATYVWIPPQLRKNINQEYEPREFQIKRVMFGTNNVDINSEKDFAFFELQQNVSEKEGNVSIPEDKMITPFRLIKNTKLALNTNLALTVGFHSDKGNQIQRNCSPFSLFEITPETGFWSLRNYFVFHDADTVGGSSGSPILLPDENGKIYYAALHVKGDRQVDDETIKTSQNDQKINIAAGTNNNNSVANYNMALKADQFIKEFEKFVLNSSKTP